MTRIGVLTSRTGQSQPLFMSTVYDFEDCIVKATGAELISVPPPKRDFASKVKRRFDLEGIHLKNSYELLFCISMDLVNSPLRRVMNWRERCNYCILYAYDAFPRIINQYESLLQHSSIQNVDLICISFSEVIPHFQMLLKPPVFWIPQGVNPHRFYYVPDIQRGISIYAFGRQPKQLLNQVREYCLERNLLMLYSYGSADYPTQDWQEAYSLHAQQLLHTEVSLNWSVDFTSPERAGGISPTTCRWFEAAATGCLVIGQQPTEPEFQSLFPISGFIENVNDTGKNITDLVEKILKDKETNNLRSTLAHYTRHHHTWYHRLTHMLMKANLIHLMKPEYLSFVETGASVD